MTPETPIRRRPDGSIDADYYRALGRAARADQARRLFAGTAPLDDRRESKATTGPLRLPSRGALA